MKKILLLCAILVIAAGLLTAGRFKDKYVSKDGVKITVYERGKKIPIDPANPRFTELQNLCESFLKSSTGPLKLIFTHKLASIIKKKESAIEVTYDKPITSMSSGKEVIADHLLIPFSGEYVKTGNNPYAEIYFYNRDAKDYVGPDMADKDVTEITNLLKMMGVDIK